MEEFKLTPKFVPQEGASHSLRVECPISLNKHLQTRNHTAKLQWKIAGRWINCEIIKVIDGDRNQEWPLPLLLLPLFPFATKLLNKYFIAQLNWSNEEKRFVQAGTRFFFPYWILQKLGFNAWEKSKWRILIEE